MPRGGNRSTSFRPGQSGNPSGRPSRPQTIVERQTIENVKVASRALTAEALETLKAVMLNGKAPPAARVGAATAILDRGWGKPAQSIETNGNLTFVQIIQKALKIENVQAPADLGEMMTVERFRAENQGLTNDPDEY
jgi:Family of unknown function (DUF5681)